MAWKFSLKGGRAWWGKREAKKAGNVTRRREEYGIVGTYLLHEVHADPNVLPPSAAIAPPAQPADDGNPWSLAATMADLGFTQDEIDAADKRGGVVTYWPRRS